MAHELKLRINENRSVIPVDEESVIQTNYHKRSKTPPQQAEIRWEFQRKYLELV